jgi:hypothetical protein
MRKSCCDSHLWLWQFQSPDYQTPSSWNRRSDRSHATQTVLFLYRGLKALSRTLTSWPSFVQHSAWMKISTLKPYQPWKSRPWSAAFCDTDFHTAASATRPMGRFHTDSISKSADCMVWHPTAEGTREDEFANIFQVPTPSIISHAIKRRIVNPGSQGREAGLAPEIEAKTMPWITT